MGQRTSPWIPLKTIQELAKILTSSHSLDQIFRRPKMMKPGTIQWRLPTAKSWDKQPLSRAVCLLLLLFWGAFPPLLTKSFSKTLAKWKWSRSVMSRLFATPWTIAYQAPPSMGFSKKNTRVGCHFLLQGIFPSQGSNPGLLHCRQTLYHLSHQERQH